MKLRRGLCVLLALPMFFAIPRDVRAQQQPPNPAPAATQSASTSCKEPNVAPRVVKESQPKVPPEAAFYGVSGQVTINITLDAASRVTNARISKSSSPIFELAALESAKSSTYQTEVVNCQGLAETFAFIVTFDNKTEDGRSVAHPLYENPATYFPGTWTCSAGASPRSVTITLGGTDAFPSLTFVSDGSEAQTLAADHYHFWHFTAAGGVELTAYPWVTAIWRFTSDKSGVDYERVNDHTFIRTDLALNKSGDQVQTTTRCVKSVSSR
jgi:TonB family protein